MSKFNFISIFLFIFINVNAWENTKRNNTSYLFAPGTFTTESSMCRYLPSFTSSTGEQITCQTGINILQPSVSACNFSDVNLKVKLNYSINPVQILSNFKKKIMYIITKYVNNLFGINVESASCGLSLDAQDLILKNVNFGQTLDINIFRNCYQKHVFLFNMEEGIKNNIILFGISRGAATIFNFVAIDKPKDVSALICEGIFDSIPNLIKIKFPLIHNFILNLLQSVTSFKIQGISPIESTKNIPLDIPLLLVTSLKDNVVPFANTINMYKQLKELRHKKVHLLILKNSGHNYYVYDEQDRKLYESVVHAFYKYYDLPYIPQLADLGQNYFFESTNPIL